MNTTKLANHGAVAGQVERVVRPLALTLACLLFAGCSAEVPGWTVTAAIAVCAERGGIDRLTTTFANGVMCRDGYWTGIKGRR